MTSQLFRRSMLLSAPAAMALGAASAKSSPFVRTDLVKPIPEPDRRIFFSEKSFALSDAAKTKIEKQAVIVRKYETDRWRIRSYATEDERNSIEGADELSYLRAMVVARQLVQYGVNENHLAIWPAGARAHIVRNTEPAALAILRFAETDLFGEA